jgi:hypothetical protein
VDAIKKASLDLKDDEAFSHTANGRFAIERVRQATAARLRAAIRMDPRPDAERFVVLTGKPNAGEQRQSHPDLLGARSSCSWCCASPIVLAGVLTRRVSARLIAMTDAMITAMPSAKREKCRSVHRRAFGQFG